MQKTSNITDRRNSICKYKTTKKMPSSLRKDHLGVPGESNLHRRAVQQRCGCGLATSTRLQQLAAIPVASVMAGYQFQFRIDPSAITERYLGLVYTVATGPMLTGTITAAVVHDVPSWKAHAKNFVTA